MSRKSMEGREGDSMIYAKLNESFQQIGGSCPVGYIKMQGERPTPQYVACEDGTWALPQQTKEQKLQQLESDYQTAVAELQKSLAVAQLRNDTALIADIQSDFAELQASYQAEKEAIENADSTETL